MDELVKVDIHYGTVEIVPAYKREGEWMYYGAYSIKRDMGGREISRTEPSYTCRLKFSCATPEPKKTLWQKIAAWLR